MGFGYGMCSREVALDMIHNYFLCGLHDNGVRGLAQLDCMTKNLRTRVVI